MPYLRGTSKTLGLRPMGVSTYSPSINYKLRALERKIAKQAPAKETFLVNHNWTASAIYDVDHQRITNTFKSSSLYDEVVLGDRFVNHWLKFRVDGPSSCRKLRITVYYVKRPGQTFPDTAGSQSNFSRIPDPAYVTVLYDKTYIAGNDTSGIHASGLVNLKGWQSIVNRTTLDTIEKGDLAMSIQTECPSVSAVLQSSYQLIFSNK